MGFFVAFVAALLIFSEYNTATSSDTLRVIFKRGAQSPIIAELKPAADEEKPPRTQPLVVGDQESQEKKTMVEQPPMSDIFSWQHLSYTVHVSDGPRVLLDDVSGYVAPGKLTALMGESGAGKVNCVWMFNILL
jgi:ATP-binding cassette subfamily G (WHITE) protein 2 (SNQ2)